VAGIIGNKKLNQKGYLLIESLVAFSILSLCMAIYIPFIVSMLKKVDAEKTTVEMYRIQYEQVQKIEQLQTTDNTWRTGGKVFTIEQITTTAQKGVRVKYEKEEISIEILSFQKVNP
jgi:type II secretory pathway pseudopilin PulG